MHGRPIAAAGGSGAEFTSEREDKVMIGLLVCQHGLPRTSNRAEQVYHKHSALILHDALGSMDVEWSTRLTMNHQSNQELSPYVYEQRAQEPVNRLHNWQAKTRMSKQISHRDYMGNILVHASIPMRFAKLKLLITSKTFFCFSGTSDSLTIMPGHQGNPFIRTQTRFPRSNSIDFRSDVEFDIFPFPPPCDELKTLVFVPVLIRLPSTPFLAGFRLRFSFVAFSFGFREFLPSLVIPQNCQIESSRPGRASRPAG
jgi:hypothetical protein